MISLFLGRFSMSEMIDFATSTGAVSRVPVGTMSWHEWLRQGREGYYLCLMRVVDWQEDNDHYSPWDHNFLERHGLYVRKIDLAGNHSGADPRRHRRGANAAPVTERKNLFYLSSRLPGLDSL